MCSIAFDLLIRGNGAEDDFSELAPLERSVCDSSYYFQWLLYDSHGQMSSVINQSGYVVFRHLWELFLENAFEASEDDKTLALVVVVDYSEFDLSVAFFDDCWLLREGYRVASLGDRLLFWLCRLALGGLDPLAVRGGVWFLGSLPFRLPLDRPHFELFKLDE